MKKSKRYFLIFTISCLGFCCRKADDYNFVGKWQSLNDASTVIEFTNDHRIALYRDGETFWGQATKNGELFCSMERDTDHRYSFNAYDGDIFFFNGQIEIMTEDRIRIYLLKHHNILDLADEYHRTNDFKSYKTIMSKILEEPEEEPTK